MRRTASWLGLFACASAAAQEAPSFTASIRPLLSRRCFACHGPAEAKSGLRLDRRESALRGGRSGEPAIAPHEPDRSAMLLRVGSADSEQRMPPAGDHEPLAAHEIELLRRWIEAGAPYARHWAFEQLGTSAPPAASPRARNAIDAFVEAALAKRGMAPAPETERGVLLRRLSLDLIGLPPSPDELARFAADARQDALELEVDRLLASQHFGERMALPWLDAARYADTNGYSIDDHRDMWAWRDWLINALNENLPYDAFVVQQIAGDLLPESDERTQLATGFLRNGMSTHEGGIIPEEYRVTYVADKVDAVATTFLGLTMRCAQCHDHKYDPLSQSDYYRMFAFFDTAIEPGVGGKNGNVEPRIEVVSPLVDEERAKAEARERIAMLELYRLHPPDLIAARAQWIAERRREVPALDDGVALSRAPQWIWSAGEAESVRFVREIELPEGLRALRFLGTCDNRSRIEWNGIQVARSEDWTRPIQVELPLAPGASRGFLIVHAENDGGPAGFAAEIELVFVDRSDRCGTDATWIAETEPAREIGEHGCAPWGRVLPLVDAALAAALHAEAPADEQWRAINAAHAAVDPRWRGHEYALESEIAVLRPTADTGRISAMVMREGPARETFVLTRGRYDEPDRAQLVEPGVPEAVFAWDPTWPRTRLGLARWMTDPRHPLTARVAVNRIWQLLFGAGLVATLNDFGSQGEVPSHRELLDHLARELIDSGWDLKALVKTIALSATYAQDARSHAEGEELDPQNRWLWRGARRRLPAELLRDQALALGGLLDLRAGGASVCAAEPEGLWQEISHFGHPEAFTAQTHYPSIGRDLYRRSLYTFWKRTSPPPSLVAFDAPAREVCTALRAQTNTPLQALVALNDPEHAAAARGFAARAERATEDLTGRLRWLFRAATAREPRDPELEILRSAWDDACARFCADGAAARAWIAEERPSGTLPERAALALVASLVLNLDETLTQH